MRAEQGNRTASLGGGGKREGAFLLPAVGSDRSAAMPVVIPPVSLVRVEWKLMVEARVPVCFQAWWVLVGR